MNDKSHKSANQISLLNDNCRNEAGEHTGCTLPPDSKLVAEGWTRRFIADLRMASDAVATYNELGYEVRLELVNTEGLSDECSGCMGLFEKFSMVYTRRSNE